MEEMNFEDAKKIIMGYMNVSEKYIPSEYCTLVGIDSSLFNQALSIVQIEDSALFDYYNNTVMKKIEKTKKELNHLLDNEYKLKDSLGQIRPNAVVRHIKEILGWSKARFKAGVELFYQEFDKYVRLKALFDCYAECLSEFEEKEKQEILKREEAEDNLRKQELERKNREQKEISDLISEIAAMETMTSEELAIELFAKRNFTSAFLDSLAAKKNMSLVSADIHSKYEQVVLRAKLYRRDNQEQLKQIKNQLKEKPISLEEMIEFCYQSLDLDIPESLERYNMLKYFEPFYLRYFDKTRRTAAEEILKNSSCEKIRGLTPWANADVPNNFRRFVSIIKKEHSKKYIDEDNEFNSQIEKMERKIRGIKRSNFSQANYEKVVILTQKSLFYIMAKYNLPYVLGVFDYCYLREMYISLIKDTYKGLKESEEKQKTYLIKKSTT